MAFGRRKSYNTIEVQQEEVIFQESRRRNRLSKPLTHKSTSNLALLALQDSQVSSRNASTEAVAAPVTPPISDTEKRQQMRAHLFDQEEEPERRISKRTSWKSVAALVNRFESSGPPSNSSQTSLLSPPKQRTSATSLFSSRRSSGAARPGLSNANSMDRVAMLKDQPANSSSASLDRIQEPAVPTSRRASFQPGTATRKVSEVESIKEQDEWTKPDLKKQERIEEEEADNSDALSFSEGDDEEWFPPPQEPRSETPLSLDYTHLGGLRLGSLQVMNGRASPATSVAASMASRHLLAQMVARRDASSEYGDSEAGDPEPRRRSIHSREVSWYSQRTSNLQHMEVFELPSRAVQQAPATDLAAEMAAEYIAELPSSPYKIHRRSSDSTLMKERPGQSSPVAELRSSCSDDSLRKSPSLETISVRSSSPVPSVASSTGSVLRTTTKRTEMEDQLFDDETLGGSRAEHLSDRASLESFHSWHSPAKPEFSRPEAFESAVEFQDYLPSQASPVRSPRQISPPHWDVSHESYNRRASQRLELPKGMVQSDSGYSSNNSVRSSSWERKSVSEQQRSHSPLRIEERIESQIRPEHSKPVGKIFKPILKTRKTAPAVPSFSELRPAAPKSAMSTVSDIPKLEAEQPKARNKLQKRNIFGRKKKQEVFVQSVASVDDLSIPAIPVHFQENLQVRNEQVPELETTYKTMHHVRNQASTSALDFPQVDIRFPSPGPDQSEAAPKKRVRSWLLEGKDKKPNPKHSSMISERDARAIVQDFGSDNYSLGRTPYDLVHEHASVTQNRVSGPDKPKVFRKPLRPRSMYDDKTASELARFRSSSIRERDSENSRKSSFNDRGGIPGKQWRPASILGDAPPMPPMPTLESLHRRISGMDNHAPPPPPSHSPRPAFVDLNENMEELELAPPPPSHSPRPMDVSEVEDSWAAQAAAWRARREGADQSVNRQSYYEDQPYIHEEVHEESVYPEIPLRGQQSAYQAQRSYSYQPNAQHSYDYENAYDQSRQQYHYQAYHPDNDYSYHHTHPQMHFQTKPYDPTQDRSSGRPLPAPQGPRRSPAPSIRSFRSTASSLAEDLHPELSDDATRQQPAPQFGRYSGGMQYGYERDNGFGGSAGTRSVSGKADVAHKGVKLREGFGVDLGDVPVIGLVQPARG